MTFTVGPDPTTQRNGDLAVRSDEGIPIRSDKGRLVALVYARETDSETRRYAEVIATALNAAFSPGHTDLMVSPEDIDAWLADNPLPAS